VRLWKIAAASVIKAHFVQSLHLSSILVGRVCERSSIYVVSPKQKVTTLHPILVMTGEAMDIRTKLVHMSPCLLPADSKQVCVYVCMCAGVCVCIVTIENA